MEKIVLEEKQFKTIIEKLDKISKLLALNLVNDCEKQKDKIIMLSSFGYGVTEIVNLLNTTKGTANQALVKDRKEKAKAKENETVTRGNTKRDSAQNLTTDSIPQSKTNKDLEGVLAHE